MKNIVYARVLNQINENLTFARASTHHNIKVKVIQFNIEENQGNK